MKIACLGGGGYYFTRPIGDIAMQEDLHGAAIALYDIDRDRAGMMASLARRWSREAGAGLRVSVSRSLGEAVDGCDFALTSIGGAGASGSSGYYESPVHLGDRVICTRHGAPQVIGDTAGPVAMMAALRSVPIYLEIARALERRAPDAILLNHANPMAVLCRAVNKHARLRGAIGFCHGVQQGIRLAGQILEVPPGELDVVWIGTNHYYWFTRIARRGTDLLPEFWKRVRRAKPSPGREMSAALSRIYGHWIVYPEDDHIIEFYPYMTQGLDPLNLPFGMSAAHYGKRMLPLYSGEETIEDVRRRDRATPRREMLAQYEARLKRARLPARDEDPLSGEGIARLMANIATGRREVHICNVPNRGAVPNLPPEAVLEVEAVSDSMGVRPLYAGEAPLALRALLEKRVAWQELVADAAATGDRGLALQAMLVDEQALPPARSERMLRELMANSAGLLPTFERRRR
jgi:alpha-galactosidase/6-phospho-beta-glucosidase family protein